MPCASGWTKFDHTCRCYKYVDTKGTWADARILCQTQSLNADLVTIPDQITNAFLTTLTTERAWIGGRKNSNDLWQWIDGTPWNGDYCSWGWGEDEPNNLGGKEDFIVFNWGIAGRWNDIAGTESYSALCQYNLSTRLLTTVQRDSFFFDWCGKNGCNIENDSGIILRQKVSSSRRGRNDPCADLRLNEQNRLRYTLTACQDLLKPLCMKGNPKISRELKSSEKFKVKRRLKKLKKTRLSQKQERLRRAKRRKQMKRQSRQENSSPVEMCATAGDTKKDFI